MQRQLKEKKSRRERLRFLEEAVLSSSSSQTGQSVGVTSRGAPSAPAQNSSV